MLDRRRINPGCGTNRYCQLSCPRVVLCRGRVETAFAPYTGPTSSPLEATAVGRGGSVKCRVVPGAALQAMGERGVLLVQRHAVLKRVIPTQA